MVRKMGPMKKVLGMMPGMGQIADMDIDDGSFQPHRPPCSRP